ncbi:MAG TPA: FAD-dependent oxidoreductase [Methylococcaceae bacterium]|nr:FAD-dependent oxidoreductase [Methylococcaceae bacterium]
MATYDVKLLRHETVAEGTMAFHFEKPADFQFKAGQSIDLTLIDPPETDAEGDTRAFSLTCAPYESELRIATRLRDSAFKRVLRNLPPGSPLRIAGPFGSFTLHKNASRPGVFLAGGIGITPFFAIAKDAAHLGLPHRLFLFYSNKRPEDAPFLDELRRLEQANPHFRLIGTMTEMENSRQPWDGERGYIGAEIVTRAVGELHGPIYYVAGPPAMVAAMRKMLEEAGADEDDIRTEEFAGY